MKKILLAISVTVLCLANVFGQETRLIQDLRAQVKSQHAEYFTDVAWADQVHIKLLATDTYASLKPEGRRGIIQNVFTYWSEAVLMVEYDSIVEIWGVSEGTGEAKLLDRIDKKAPFVPKGPVLVGRPRPWFFYVGGLLSLDSQQNLHLGVSLRIGTFLLKNRWDLAVSTNFGASGNLEYESTPYFNLGLMTRVHFPIRKIGLTPNIGAELSVGLAQDADPSLKPYGLVGFSWFVGGGSINVGVNIGKGTYGTLGFTIFPAGKKFR